MSQLQFSGLLVIWLLSSLFIATLTWFEFRRVRFNFNVFFSLLFLLTFFSVLGFATLVGAVGFCASASVFSISGLFSLFSIFLFLNCSVFFNVTNSSC